MDRRIRYRHLGTLALGCVDLLPLEAISGLHVNSECRSGVELIFGDKENPMKGAQKQGSHTATHQAGLLVVSRHSRLEVWGWQGNAGQQSRGYVLAFGDGTRLNPVATSSQQGEAEGVSCP